MENMHDPFQQTDPRYATSQFVDHRTGRRNRNHLRSKINAFRTCLPAPKQGIQRTLTALKISIFSFQLKEKNLIISKNTRTIAMITIVL
jgi:hypothetical protein